MIKNPLVSNQRTVQLEAFRKDLLDMVKSIKFRNINNKFQNLMKADVAKVKASPNLFIPADKTTNMYELSPAEEKKLFRSKTACKLDDKIECTDKNSVFTTLKVHKTNFSTSVPCRLLNRYKSDFGKISKLILEKRIRI